MLCNVNEIIAVFLIVNSIIAHGYLNVKKRNDIVKLGSETQSSYYAYVSIYNYTGSICAGSLIKISTASTQACFLSSSSSSSSYSCASDGTLTEYIYSDSTCSSVSSSSTVSKSCLDISTQGCSSSMTCSNSLPSDLPQGNTLTITYDDTTCTDSFLEQQVGLQSYCYDVSTSGDLESSEFTYSGSLVTFSSYSGSAICSSDFLSSTIEYPINTCFTNDGNYIYVSSNQSTSSGSSNLTLILGLSVGLGGGGLILLILLYVYKNGYFNKRSNDFLMRSSEMTSNPANSTFQST